MDSKLEDLVGRNQPLVFARRTRKNLERIKKASADGEDVHPVVQLANSLLGLIVIPWERDTLDSILHHRLETLKQQGWPCFNITKGRCHTLEELIQKLRNSVAHGHMRFSSDEKHYGKVILQIKNIPWKQKEPDWCAEISVEELQGFCEKLINLVEDFCTKGVDPEY
jgi:hypothetical protein